MSDARPVKRGLVYASMMLIAGCTQREPRTSDADMQLIRAENPGMTEACLRELRWGGVDAMPAKLEQCFKMTPPRRWSGLWRNAFEGSRFCPAPARECSYDTSGDRIWLNFETKLPEEIRQGRSGGLYAIDFVGRRTLKKGSYGHLGMSDHEIVVDRLISIERVPEEVQENE